MIKLNLIPNKNEQIKWTGSNRITLDKKKILVGLLIVLSCDMTLNNIIILINSKI